MSDYMFKNFWAAEQNKKEHKDSGGGDPVYIVLSRMNYYVPKAIRAPHEKAAIERFCKIRNVKNRDLHTLFAERLR
jgi:hypothetical protein